MTPAGDAKPAPRATDQFAGAASVCHTAAYSLICFSLPMVGRSDGYMHLVYSFSMVLVGLLIPLKLFPHPFRVLGLIPPANVGVLVSVVTAWAFGTAAWNGMLLGLAVGIVSGAELRYLRLFDRARLATGHGWRRKWSTLDTVLTFGLLAAFVCYPLSVLTGSGEPTDWPNLPYLWWYTFGVTFFLLVFSWVRLFRPFFELCVEAVVWRNYRISAAGPGSSGLPTDGPMLVIANHACWWDPLFLAKVLPRPVTPMMTSVFFDKWFLRPLMVHVFQTIRVADARVRRETPEIQEAIRALDEGKCVVIFPEGYLRRKEEVPLRRFGRGVWEILKARPNTPVVACWIEGGWGSYASYCGGPPTKNKPKERRRPIRIGMSAPFTLPADRFEEHLPTRIALMNEVLTARSYLELPELPRAQLPTHDQKEDSSQPAES
jgi:1-acyl-sn-glycerol-3-phosphate acyltransferase